MKNLYKRRNYIGDIRIVLIVLFIFCIPFAGCSQQVQNESSGLDSPQVETLIAALKDTNYTVRLEAAQRLGEIQDVRAIELLIAALLDENSGVRMTAAQALGKIKDARAVEALITAVEDEEASVRREVAKALGETKDASRHFITCKNHLGSSVSIGTPFSSAM